MKPLAIKINNFGSFGGKESIIPLADRGLVLIEGENRAAKSASSNGAGKTTLMDALVWCLFGKTSKDCAADDVINDQIKKDCSVELLLEDSGENHIVKRYRKHSEFENSLHFFKITTAGEKISLAGVDTKETQDRIEHFLGFSYPLFLNSVYFSQEKLLNFSQMTDKQLKDVFIKVRNLERFQDALAAVRVDTLETARLIVAENAKLKTVGEEIERVTEEIESYQKSHAEFGDTKEKELAAIRIDIDEVKSKMVILIREMKEIPSIEKQIDECKTSLTDLPIHEKALEDFRKGTLTPLRDKRTTLQTRFDDLTRQIGRLLIDQKSGKEKIGTPCPECGQIIVAGALEGYLKRIEEKLTEFLNQRNKMSEIIAKAEPKFDELAKKEEELSENVAAFSTVRTRLARLEENLSGLRRRTSESAELARKLKTLEERLHKKETETSPFGGYITEATKRKSEATTRQTIIKAEIEKLTKTSDQLSYWERGFGYSGIQSFLLDACTPFLNERAAHYSSIVTGGELSIEFSTTVMGKKGIPKDKFAIDIAHTNGGKKYGVISGGEKRRADVCVSQAMFALARNHGKKPLDLILFDEPFDSSLDPEGIAGVVELLQEISKEIGTVLVVSHIPALKSSCESVIQVIKESDGFSHIEE